MQPLFICGCHLINIKSVKMKKSIFFLAFMVTAALISASSIIQNDTEVRDLGDFSEVSVSAGINLHLVHGNQNKAVIEVDDIDLDDVITEIKGDRLVLKVDNNKWGWNWKSKRKIDITLTYKEIDELSASSGSRVRSDHTLSGEDLEFTSSSGASIELEVECKELTADASSGASISLSGQANTIEVDVSSGASIKASDLEADYVSADASSGGSIKVWAKEGLDADVSSGGSVRYKGNPGKLSKDKSSGGSVSPM